MPRIGPLRNKTVLLVRDHEIRFLSGVLAPSRFLRESLSQYLSRVAYMYNLEAEDLHIINDQGERLLEWIDCEGSKCQTSCFVCISVQRRIEGHRRGKLVTIRMLVRIRAVHAIMPIVHGRCLEIDHGGRLVFQ